jgi:topoisomerase IV subunit A
MADNENDNIPEEEFAPDNNEGQSQEHEVPIRGMFKEWFLDYASYVILERAVPALEDGMKPVQRRILHAMKELDDGRFNKVANIIGHTMKYHPHGDASIGDALVQIGQKEIAVETQGNWGNILTGDGAAAPRYIEARLSKFANEVMFNSKTTNWQLSYDGRNKEPIHLPIKFPILLAQGAEGIAVGLACKILPHNFNELIDGSIDILKGKKVSLVPDFPSGGMADFTNYNDGLRGGRIRVRAKIRKEDKKTLVIDEVPFGTTTTSLIESIVKATEKGKIKIKNIEDNTSDKVEIIINLVPGISPDKTIDALYAFTDCEISISPNACVIENDKPRFLGVSEMLRISTERTLGLLKLELEIKKGELEEQWHFSSLEKIFIENRIYRDIEECETWEAVIEAIDKGLKPFIKHLKRPVTEEDIVRLTEIKIKRISKFDSFKADEQIRKLEEQLDEVNHHLNNLTEYAVAYFKELKKKYGVGKERKTEIKIFDTIEAAKVVVANKKLYINRQEGFIGYGLKKDELIGDCSDIDDIIIFREDGVMMVTKIDNKKFVGKNIIHAGVWKKGDKRTIYNIVYQDGKGGKAMIKRFPVSSITRDREYDITSGSKDSKILYFTANPNGEAETIQIILRPRPNLKKLKFEFDFSELAIKGRAAKGNTLTKNLISKITLKEKGASTLSARKIWFDDVVHRLNVDERGEYLGRFSGDDKILTLMQSGNYQLTGFSLSTHFDEDLVSIEKFDTAQPVTAVYFNGEKKCYYVKRFLIEETDKKTMFITEDEGSFLELVTTAPTPIIKIQFDKRSKDKEDEVINLEEFIAVKGLKAIGNKLTSDKIKAIDLISTGERKNPDEIGIKEELADINEEEETEQSGETDLVTNEEVLDKDVLEITQVEKDPENKDNSKENKEGKPQDGQEGKTIYTLKEEDKKDKEGGSGPLQIEFEF